MPPVDPFYESLGKTAPPRANAPIFSEPEIQQMAFLSAILNKENLHEKHRILLHRLMTEYAAEIKAKADEIRARLAGEKAQPVVTHSKLRTILLTVTGDHHYFR